MSYEETIEWSDFVTDWKPDGLNIPVRAYWFKDDSELNVEFAHPRKLTMSSITVTGWTREMAEKWIKDHRPDQIDLEDL